MPPFGPRTVIIGAVRPGRRRAAPAGDRLLERERELLGRLRQHDQVVGARVEGGLA